MAGPPVVEPIGLRLTRVAKEVGRAFDDALGEVGGSLPVWVILVSLKSGRHGAQREVAAAVGIEGATLTHHLNRLERAGLVTRARDPGNRRVQRVELTEAGDAAFFRMLGAVQAFDERLRSGISEAELSALEAGLARLHANVSTREEHPE